MVEADNPENGAAVVLNLRAASALAKVSKPTLRKYLQAGTLPAEKTEGKHGEEWQIAWADLAAFVLEQYGRRLRPYSPPREKPEQPYRGKVQVVESAEDLRARLDTVLEELGRYKALTERAEDANRATEDHLKDTIAELRAERDTALAELEAERRRGFWRRLFG